MEPHWIILRHDPDTMADFELALDCKFKIDWWQSSPVYSFSIPKAMLNRWWQFYWFTQAHDNGLRRYSNYSSLQSLICT